MRRSANTPTYRLVRLFAMRTRSWRRKSSPGLPTRGRSPDIIAAGGRQTGGCRRGLRATVRSQHQRRHDRSERLGDGTLTDMTFTFPMPTIRAPARSSTVPRTRSGSRCCRAPPKSRKSRSSASACGHMPASPLNVCRSGRAADHIRAITTSEIKISMLIDASQTNLAVRTLHSLYGLDKD